MNLRYILSILAMSMTIVSCTTTEEIVCEPGFLGVYATGFTKADFDSAIVTRYTAGSSLSNVIDTAGVEVIHKGGDTAHLMIVPLAAARTPVPFPNGYLGYGADYRLYIPKLGRWYVFKDITLAGNTKQTIRHRRGELKHYFCTNHVVSCKVDGVNTFVQDGGGYDVVYISK